MARTLTASIKVDAVNRLAILPDIDRLAPEPGQLEALAVPRILGRRSPDGMTAHAQHASHLEDLKVQLGLEVLVCGLG
jgi:hypothetical protein